MEKNGIEPLEITIAHALRVHHLPLHHRDPFDRILVAQSLAAGLTIITADPLIAQYPVRVVW
jgi:PIN domain nuclease of toxin-antitoxin system